MHSSLFFLFLQTASVVSLLGDGEKITALEVSIALLQMRSAQKQFSATHKSEKGY